MAKLFPTNLSRQVQMVYPDEYLSIMDTAEFLWIFESKLRRMVKAENIKFI
jgi:hypothetical protein